MSENHCFRVHNFVYFNQFFTVYNPFKSFFYRLFLVLIFALFIFVIKDTCRGSFQAQSGPKVVFEIQKLLSENLSIFTRLTNFCNQLIDKIVSVKDSVFLIDDSLYHFLVILLKLEELSDPNV